MKIVINLARTVNERRYLGARIVVKRTNYRNLLTISPPSPPRYIGASTYKPPPLPPPFISPPKSCVSHGACFSIVPIINGPVKLSVFVYRHDRGFNSFASNMIKLLVN